MWHSIEFVADVVQYPHRTSVLALYAGELERENRREPADGPAQVDVRLENRPAEPLEVDGDNAVADCRRDRAAQRGEEYLVDGQLKPAPGVIDLGCLLVRQYRRHPRQIVGPRRFGGVLLGQPQSCPGRIL